MIEYLRKDTSAAPLAVFRMAFGLMLFIGVIRFWSNGWIEELYIKPKYFFPFYGFEYVVPLGSFTYWAFAVCGIAAVMVAIGAYYRIAIITLFVSFTYIELIDKTTYLNHYYFVSMISLMLIFLPANVYFSVDAWRKRGTFADRIPLWCLDALKLFVCILYFYAGLAKINTDWLLEAIPLKIWLPAKNDIPLIGFLFNYKWLAFAFSWFGCLYDLTIPFLLWNKTTRGLGYVAVVVFHLLTSLLFPIGMFPYIMIVTALIFFSSDFHHRVLEYIGALFRIPSLFVVKQHRSYAYPVFLKNAVIAFFALFFAFQLLFPWRYLCYPGELFWTEQGYRFSWRVMLMEKAGFAEFTVKSADGKKIIVNNYEFLTPLQEKMMATQPDMILQYAHLLRDHYAGEGFESPEVYVDSYVACNGRLGKRLVSATVDLAKENDSFKHKPWIESRND